MKVWPSVCSHCSSKCFRKSSPRHTPDDIIYATSYCHSDYAHELLRYISQIANTNTLSLYAKEDGRVFLHAKDKPMVATPCELFSFGSGSWKTAGDATDTMSDVTEPWFAFNVNTGDTLIVLEVESAPDWLKEHEDIKDNQVSYLGLHNHRAYGLHYDCTHNLSIGTHLHMQFAIIFHIARLCGTSKADVSVCVHICSHLIYPRLADSLICTWQS